MHEAEVLAAVIRTGVGLMALLFVVFKIMIPTLRENFRQRLFELRREMFLYMADGHVSADEPIYGHIRTVMNSLLRSAEQLTFTRIVISLVAFRDHDAEYSRRIEALMDRVPDPVVRLRLNKFRTAIGHQIVGIVFWTSPLLMCLVLIVLVVAQVRNLFRGGLRATESIKSVVGQRMERILEAEVEAESMSLAA